MRYGREDAFKLVPGRLIGERVLIGVETAVADAERLLALGTKLGLPGAGLDLLLPRAAQANAVFFGFEALDSSCVCKVYLEFWDVVRSEARRTGSRAPQLLHLGVKWDSARPGQHAVARYHCYPLLGLRAILRRMEACHADASPALLHGAQDIVRMAAQRNPAASMLYLEVREDGNPRSSYDINLYKSGMLVADAGAQLRQAGAHLGIDAALLEASIARLGPCPLGHLSSGLDRHGQQFLSVYGEIAALS